MAEKRRIRFGYKSSSDKWYAHGKPGSERHRQYILDRMKKWRKEKMVDPEYRNAVNEYHRIWRNVKAGSVSRVDDRATGKDTMYVRKPFDEFLREMNISYVDLERMTGIDEGVFRNSRGNNFINLSVVDRFFTSFGMPDQVAVLWPYDDQSLRKSA